MVSQNPYYNQAGQPSAPDASAQVTQAPAAAPVQPQSSTPSASAPVPPVAYAQPAPAAAAAVAKKRNYVPIIVILALVAAIIFGMASCAKSLSNLGSLGDGSDVGFQNDTVAIITIDGTIQYDGSACSPEGLKTLLDEASEDDHVKAVVLRVNSGGGTATAGEEMATYVREFDKPVLVSSSAINASAAYEISSQADYIYTAKTTEIGAIGTVMQVTDFSGLLEKLGVDIDNIASAESKDSSYGTRPLTEEERQYYQDMIDEINSVFIDNVAEGRGMTHEQASELATGLTWTGITAVENGIADEIGTLEDACQKAAELGGCADDYETQDLYLSSSELYNLLGLLTYDKGQSISTEELAAALKELSEHDATIE
ncbi:MAG: signal peptide peptidase SppA [Eggerthellaceae bacterium]|nr:signal peptide peptidase SppA [Eggerthellaceae bacterium]